MVIVSTFHLDDIRGAAVYVCDSHRAFSHDVTAAMKRNDGHFGVQGEPSGSALYTYANTFFCLIKPI